MHRGGKTPRSLAAASATLPTSAAATVTDEVGAPGADAVEETYGSDPLPIREKEHAAEPMTLDQALYEMELVGHDFFLFPDAETGLPSVVYRRKGYDYGVIRLAK